MQMGGEEVEGALVGELCRGRVIVLTAGNGNFLTRHDASFFVVLEH